MLQCSKCKEFKDESCFNKRSDRKRWYSYSCKECNSVHKLILRNIRKEKHKEEYHFRKIRDCIQWRCCDQNNKWYHRYWGRWIKCLRKTFNDFKYDMWPSYLEHCANYWIWMRRTQIDRIDNNWNYCKKNCRRVTAKENHPRNHAKEFSS